LRNLREDLGLGSPPKSFYTHNSESINALLKECTGYKKQQLALFNNKMKEAVKQQQREVEKAIIGYGEDRLRPQYSSLTVPVEKWFCMSTEQRQMFIKKLNAATIHQFANSAAINFEQPLISEESLTSTVTEQPLILTPTVSEKSLTPTGKEQPLTLTSGQLLISANHPSADSALDDKDQDITIGRFANEKDATKEQTLSVSLQDAVTITALPYTAIEGIWKKAASLVTEVNSILPAPGLGPKEKMVKSKSGSTPHLVSINGLKYECDDKCL